LVIGNSNINICYDNLSPNQQICELKRLLVELFTRSTNDCIQLRETVYIHDGMANVNRNMWIHFNTRFFKGFKHEDIANELEKEIQTDDKNLFN